MDAGRWNRIKELVAAAGELATGERAVYLDRACGGDAALRTEIESLLSAAEKAPALLDQPAFDALAPELAMAEKRLIGGRLGPYEITRLLGTGGMGSVYLGKRADNEFQQAVAIKVIRGGLFDSEAFRRFSQERQTLANLNHPHIARLLDGGRSADGVPYLVMEYVAGEPIDAYCDARRLALGARLHLFRRVCGAVHYAHQNLTVHRDLKPANILVTQDGSPKLLDFGIAKVLRASETPQRGNPSMTMQPCLTPEYSSPEQIRGESVSTASDVYSLGVLLYELLVGHRPFQASSGSYQALANTICNNDPEKPSTAARRAAESRAGALSPVDSIATESASAEHGLLAYRPWRRLIGDLDAIVLKAMRKEPHLRYGSVEQLSEDILRHLDGLPVQARLGTWRYRSAKFVRRNWMAAAAFAAVAASLLAATFVSLRAAQVAERERDAALDARRIARDEAENARVEARKSERVRSFLQSMLRAANPTREGPETTVGALLDDAAAHVAEDVGDDPEIESAVRWAIGDAYVGMGRYPAAETQLKAALEIQRRIHKNDHTDVASALNVLGTLYHARGEWALAQDSLEQALAINKRLLGEEHRDVAQNMNNLGVVLRHRGEDARAEQMLRGALAMRRRLFGNQDSQTAESLNNLAFLLGKRKDYLGAEPICREALEIRRAQFGENHALVTQAIHNLAVILARSGRASEAEPLLRDATDRYRSQLGPNHPELAGSLFNLGELLLNAGEPSEAEPFLQECLAIRRRALPQGDTRTAQALGALGRCLVHLCQFAEAEAVLKEAHETQHISVGAAHEVTLAAINDLIELYDAWDRPEESACYRALRLPD